MIAFSTSVNIARPIDEVFSYLSDLRNLPAWNSAVQVTRSTSTETTRVGSTYTMERQLPTGHATNQLEITAYDQPREFAIGTTSGPTPFRYRYRFSMESSETVVQLEAQVELPRAAALLGRLAVSGVRRGVDDNLATLKQILERRPSAIVDVADRRLASRRR